MITFFLRAVIRYYFRVGRKWLLLDYLLTFAGSLLILVKDRREGRKRIFSMLKIVLLFSLIIVFTSTVFARTPGREYQYILDFLWSHRAAWEGKPLAILDLAENIILLLPVGVLLPLIDYEKYGFFRTVTAGFICSLLIELSQLIFKLGIFEFDDLFNNTLGVVIGFLATKALTGFINIIRGLFSQAG